MNRADDEIGIIGLSYFELTTVDSAMNACTFARVTIGRPYGAAPAMAVLSLSSPSLIPGTDGRCTCHRS